MSMDSKLSGIMDNSTLLMSTSAFLTSESNATFQCDKSLTGSEIVSQLEELSNIKAFVYLPVIIFLVVLIFFGSIGNVMVIYIYCCVYRHKPSNSFIVAMAIYDFLAASIVIPIDIYDLIHHYTYFNEATCRSFRFFDTMTTFGSAIILIAIAFDRYFKIKKPLSFNLCTRTVPMCILTVFGSTILSVPAVFLFGIRRRDIPGYSFCGYDCSITEEVKGTLFEKIYYAVLLLIFVITFLLMLGLYISIWMAIKKRRRKSISDRTSRSSVSQEMNGGRRTNKPRQRILSSSTSDDDSVFLKNGKNSFSRQISNSSRRSRMSSISEAMSRMKCTKTTKIFVAVSLAYVLSYLPSTLVLALKSSIKNLETDSSDSVQAILKLFSRFHFLNNAINPIIYSFLNAKFREHCITAVRKMFTRCKQTIQRDNRRSSHRKIKMSRSDSNKSEKSDKTHIYEMGTLKRETKQ